MSGEQTLREAGTPGSGLYFVLTTHRVRLKQVRLGRGELVSIMLDEVSSCAVAQRSNPFLLGFAALAVLAGLINAAQDGAVEPLIAGAIVAGVLWAIYVGTRKQVLELRSSGATLRMNTKGMPIEAVEEFIDAVEKAKHGRYLLR